MAFIGVLKLYVIHNLCVYYCITLAFIGVLKHKLYLHNNNLDCITLAFIGVLKLQDDYATFKAVLYHIGVYRGIKTDKFTNFLQILLFLLILGYTSISNVV